VKYTVYTIRWSERTHRNEYVLAAILDGDEWVGRPQRVLSVWLQETDPMPGTYRCEGERGRAAMLSWQGSGVGA